MKVYVGKNSRGKWKASLTLEHVEKLNYLMEQDLPVYHGKVYLIETYYGCSYNYGLVYPIQDVFDHSREFFGTVSSLKKSDMWQKALKLARNNPKDFHVDDFSIISDDCGKKFTFGDVMEDMFSMKILCIKVYD